MPLRTLGILEHAYQRGDIRFGDVVGNDLVAVLATFRELYSMPYLFMCTSEEGYLASLKYFDGELVLSIRDSTTSNVAIKHHLTKEGRIGPAFDDPIPYDPRTRPWFKKAMKADATANFVVSEIYQDFDTGVNLETYIGISRNSTGSIVALFGVDVEVSSIHEKLRDTNHRAFEPRNSSSHLFLLDPRNGRVIASSNVLLQDRLNKAEPVYWNQTGRADVKYAMSWLLKDFKSFLSVTGDPQDMFVLCRLFVLMCSRNGPFVVDVGILQPNGTGIGSDSRLCVVAVERDYFFSFVSSSSTKTIVLAVFVATLLLSTAIWDKVREHRRQVKEYARGVHLKERNKLDMYQKSLKKKEASNWNVVKIVVITSVAITASYFVWYGGVEATVEEVVFARLQQIMNEVFQRTRDFASEPREGLILQAQSVELGWFPFENVTSQAVSLYGNASAIEAANRIDRCNLDRMDEFQQPSMIYAGVQKTGMLFGAGVKDGRQIIKAKDGTTGGMYYTFGVNAAKTHRNASDIVSARSDYDPRQRPWYADAKETMSWGDVYLFSSGELGVTATVRFGNASEESSSSTCRKNCALDAEGCRCGSGVLACDVSLSRLTEFLRQLNLGSVPGVVFLMDRFGNLLGASHGKVTTVSAGGVSRMNASSSDNPLIRRTAVGLFREFDTDVLNFTTPFSGSLWPGSEEGELLTLVQPLSSEGLDGWFLAVSYQRYDFFQTFEEATDQAFLIGVGVIILTVYFVAIISSASIEQEPEKPPSRAPSPVPMPDEQAAEEELTLSDMYKAAVRELEPLVQRVLRVNPGANKFEMALQFAQDSFEGRDIVDILWYEGKCNSVGLALHRFHSSALYRSLMNLVVLCQCALAIFEAPHAMVNDPPQWILFVVEGSALFLHLLDLVLFAFSSDLKKSRLGAQSGVVVRKIRTMQAFRMLVLFAMISDFLIRLVTNYTTGPVPEYPLHLPYSALLRPLLFLPHNMSLLTAARSFCSTLLAAKDVFILFIAFMMITGAMMTVLFADKYDFGLSRMRGFDGFRAAFLSAFVFLSSSNNWYEVTSPPAGAKTGSWFSYLYFMAVAVVGSFVLTSLVIAIFETKYSELHLRDRNFRKAKRRMGLVAGFLFLDDSRQLLLRPAPFLKSSNTGLKFEYHSDLRLSPREFCETCEVLHPYFGTTGSSDSDKGVAATYSWYDKGSVAAVRSYMAIYFDSRAHKRVMLCVTLLNLWLLCLYGTFDNMTSRLDTFNLFLLAFFAFEVLCRILSSGWSCFWSKPQSFYQQQANRYDMCIAVCSLAAFVVTRIVSGQLAEFDPNRVVLCIPVFRIFSGIRSVQALFFGMIASLSAFGDIAGLWMLTWYSFAVGGCLLFAHVFEKLDSDTTFSNVDSNFNSIMEAISTLFELMLGDVEPMYAAIDSVGVNSFIYFVLWFVLVGMLTSNLIVGIIVNAFDTINSLRIAKGSEKISTRDMNRALKGGDGEEDGDDDDFHFKIHVPDNPWRNPVKLRRLEKQKFVFASSRGSGRFQGKSFNIH